jgi:hypothetical protein
MIALFRRPQKTFFSARRRKGRTAKGAAVIGRSRVPADLTCRPPMATNGPAGKGAMRKAAFIYLILLAAAAAGEAGAMRCGSRLISEGDPRERVISECGPPADIQSWEEERYHHFDAPPPPTLYREYEGYGNAYRVKIIVRVEVWTYNHGPSRFVDYVRIENGRVRRVYSGGYGW